MKTRECWDVQIYQGCNKYVTVTWPDATAKEIEDNVRLIKAAPELLEACKMALKALKATSEATFIIESHIQQPIAKAEA